jgi:hypothetical protein
MRAAIRRGSEYEGVERLRLRAWMGAELSRKNATVVKQPLTGIGARSGVDSFHDRAMAPAMTALDEENQECVLSAGRGERCWLFAH